MAGFSDAVTEKIDSINWMATIKMTQCFFILDPSILPEEYSGSMKVAGLYVKPLASIITDLSSELAFITRMPSVYIDKDIARVSDIPTSTVLYTPQDLTDEEKAQVRENIGVQGGSITTVSFVDHYDNEADESNFVCPLTFEEVKALTNGKTPKPVFFSVADSESSDWGYVTMTAGSMEINEVGYISLTIYLYMDKLYFAFSESGEALAATFSFAEDFNINKLERWGAVSWGVSE